MPASLPVSVGDEVDADLLNEISGTLDCAAYYLGASLSPLTSTANTNASILTGSFSFTSGYAYEINLQCRFSVAGTPSATADLQAYFGLTRTNASGTAIFNSGFVNTSANNQDTHFLGAQIVKCTAGDTTQTICFFGRFSSQASATSMAVTINGGVSPCRMMIRRIGLASQFPDAIEVPTS